MKPKCARDNIGQTGQNPNGQNPNGQNPNGQNPNRTKSQWTKSQRTKSQPILDGLFEDNVTLPAFPII